MCSLRPIFPDAHAQLPSHAPGNQRNAPLPRYNKVAPEPSQPQPMSKPKPKFPCWEGDVVVPEPSQLHPKPEPPCCNSDELAPEPSRQQRKPEPPCWEDDEAAPEPSQTQALPKPKPPCWDDDGVVPEQGQQQQPKPKLKPPCWEVDGDEEEDGDDNDDDEEEEEEEDGEGRVILVKVEACATPAMLCAARKSISGLFHCFPVCVFQLSQGRRAASAAAARSKADSKSKLLLKHKFVGYNNQIVAKRYRGCGVAHSSKTREVQSTVAAVFYAQHKRAISQQDLDLDFTRGDLQPDCPADRPVIGPRQPT
eukprot:630323-Pelagomonas_calceolata.AAC.1